jgi:hypothetical protein
MGVAVAMETADSTDHFGNAERKFDELTTVLRNRQTAAMDFSDLEKMIEKDGREVLRLLLEAHVRSRGLGDIGSSIEGSDGGIRTHRRIGERQIKSIFGTIEFERLSYGGRGEESLFPKDAHLNLPAEQSHSHELQRRVALEVIKGSFDQAVESANKGLGIPIPKQQVEHIAARAGADFDTFYARDLSEERLAVAKKTPLLVLTMDGKGIVMRKGDLRPATRKKAESQTHKLEGRLSPGEKRNSKRMATVASVYNIELWPRSAADFQRDLSGQDKSEREPRPKPLAKRVWASVEKEPAQVVEEMFAEALRRDPDKKKTWIALVDGAPKQISLIEEEAKRLGVTVTVVCDIIHVVEYLWKAAWVFFDKGDTKAEAWVNERFIWVLEGRASIVAAAVRRSATNRKLKKADREAIDTCSDYLLNKAPYLCYDDYLCKGFPIATGVIEGACRHLIKDRMDLTGARWSLAGAEAILRLRSLKSSGDFSDYWRFHEEQEFLRNHKSKYRRPSVINKLHIKKL